MKVKKFLIIGLCIIFIAMSVGSSVLSLDVHHIEHCQEEDCSLCKLIAIAIDFVKEINLICMVILSLLTIIPLTQLIKNIIESDYKKKTLIDLKVIQLN